MCDYEVSAQVAWWLAKNWMEISLNALVRDLSQPLLRSILCVSASLQQLSRQLTNLHSLYCRHKALGKGSSFSFWVCFTLRNHRKTSTSFHHCTLQYLQPYALFSLMLLWIVHILNHGSSLSSFLLNDITSEILILSLACPSVLDHSHQYTKCNS